MKAYEKADGKRYQIHMSICVRGILNWDRRETKRMLPACRKTDGTPFTSVEEFRDAMMDELAKGHEVLPMGEACEGFDYKTGCPGHPIPDEEAAP